MNSMKAFGELVEVLVDGGKAAELGQFHTGYYYHAAANYTQKRKEKFLSLTLKITESDAYRLFLDRLKAGALPDAPSFYGQPSTLVGVADAENLLAFHSELSVDHSPLIVSLLTRAYEHFQVYLLSFFCRLF